MRLPKLKFIIAMLALIPAIEGHSDINPGVTASASVIAKVGDQMVLDRDVRVDSLEVKHQFRFLHSRDPKMPDDAQALVELKHEMEADNLRSRLRKFTMAYEMQRRRFTATDEEVASLFERQWSAGMNRLPAVAVANMRKLFEAVSEVYEQHRDSDKVFEQHKNDKEFVAVGMDKDRWESWLIDYRNSARRQAMLDMSSKESAFRSRKKYLEWTVKEIKLKDIIVRELTDTDPKFGESLAAIRRGGSVDIVGAAVTYSRDKTWNWIDLRMNQAGSEILSPEFRDMAATLNLKPPPSTQPAP